MQNPNWCLAKIKRQSDEPTIHFNITKKEEEESHLSKILIQQFKVILVNIFSFFLQTWMIEKNLINCYLFICILEIGGHH